MTERRERRYQIVETGEIAWMRTFRCVVTAVDKIQFQILQRYARRDSLYNHTVVVFCCLALKQRFPLSLPFYPALLLLTC